MSELLEHLDKALKQYEEEADDKRNELLRLESFIWGMKSAQAIAKSMIILREDDEP